MCDGDLVAPETLKDLHRLSGCTNSDANLLNKVMVSLAQSPYGQYEYISGIHMDFKGLWNLLISRGFEPGIIQDILYKAYAGRVPVGQIVWAGVLAVRRIEPVLKPTDYLVVRLNPNMKEFWG